MDLYVFDKHFNLLGIVDKFTTLIWTREYFNIGTLELHVLIDDNTLSLLQKDNIVVKQNNLEEAMYIDSIYMDRDIGDTMTVRGFSIENFLEDRFVWGTQTYSGTAEEILRSFVSNNAITPTKINRIMPYLTLGSVYGVTETSTEVNTGSKLSELLKELSLKYDIGWRVRFDRDNEKYVLEFYRGLDSSIGQDINQHKIFSSEYENVFDQRYTDSDSSLKTMVFVAGAGEGTARITTTIGDELSGFARKELYVDARDISEKDSNNNTIPQATYINLLKERGNLKLKEHETVRTFESGVSVLSNLAYRVDFDLGDKVTVENKKWGLILNTRITSVEEIYENGITTINVNFGSVIPTLETYLNKAVK